MKHQLKKLGTLLGSMLMILPTASYGGVGTLADEPLWLGANVKHNILLSIDDSGSMTFETLLPTNDGALWWDTTKNSYVNTTKGVPNYEADYKMYYLFPVGLAGSRIISPLRNNAFVRSSDYNKAYYDPSVTYLPWPSYGGYSFSNQDPTAAKLDPLDVGESGTLNLTTSQNGTFISWAGEWCNDTGTIKCSGNFYMTYNYYPATYYVKDTTSTYTYMGSGATASAMAASSTFTTADSVLIEPEDTSDPDVSHQGQWDPFYSGTPVVDASVGYSGRKEAGWDSLNNVPQNSEGQLVAKFRGLSGKVAIWFRVWWPNGNADSFWVKLDGYDKSTVDEFDANTWKSSNRWYQWKDHVENQNAGYFSPN